MTFCTINGINIPIEDRAAGADVDIFGRPKRGIDGTGEGSLSNYKRVFNLSIPIVSNSDFIGYQGLVSGQGHVVSFQYGGSTADGVFASTDPSASNMNVYFAVAGGAVPAFDGGGFYFNIPPYDVLWGLRISFMTQGWTMAWVTDNDAATSGISGDHLLYAKTDENTGYINGVNQPYVPATWDTIGLNNLVASQNNMRLTQASGAYAHTKKLHEIVFLPFRLSTSQLTEITTRTKRFGNLPYISLSGDIVGGSSVTCIGTSGTSDFVPSSFSGSFGANNKMTFTLQEK